jgi:hypothetical protein
VPGGRGRFVVVRVSHFCLGQMLVCRIFA